ncbi:MAG TPA: hypothetical protein VFQ61_18420 [Polyangiaceae bacterium]|nr:hypothetical protein [Polyangiaceae bacterium]
MNYNRYSRCDFTGGLLGWASVLASMTAVLACDDDSGQPALTQCPTGGGSGGSSSTSDTSGGVSEGAASGRTTASAEGGTTSAGTTVSFGGTSAKDPQTGGSKAMGGVTQVATEPEGGAGGTEPTTDVPTEGGAGGGTATTEPNPPDTNSWTSICEDNMGMFLPYDFSRGIAGEYAFELSVSCDLGGYLLPLVVLDPVNLTGVDAWVTQLTDWLRGRVLVCNDDFSKLPPDDFSILPSSQRAGMSRGDFNSSVQLFLSVMARHDGLPDGINPEFKTVLQERLASYAESTVSVQSDALTKQLSPPDCIPPL